ncbi:protein of unknown function (plasmid) [Cupriavidus taiwanensis]|uniref:Uncharacterized protein n=1 Tax=Cupriavidus taiwanensis TaxID=164546 RepID=A0A375I5V0_9BURK|nr:hypothetical protein CT19425_U400003 [Cupriavidus taiwanensis]SPK74730.1 protein of unknown function [Cupriavidus taiwanensis]
MSHADGGKRWADAGGAYHSFYRTYLNIYFALNFVNSVYDARGQRGGPATRRAGFARRSTALAVSSIPGAGNDLFV